MRKYVYAAVLGLVLSSLAGATPVLLAAGPADTLNLMELVMVPSGASIPPASGFSSFYVVVATATLYRAEAVPAVIADDLVFMHLPPQRRETATVLAGL